MVATERESGPTAMEDWPSSTVTLTDENFEDVVDTYPTVLVYMWAEACAPCKELKPELATLAEEWADDVVLGTLKTDDFPDLAKRNRSLRGRLIGKLSSDLDGPSPTFLLFEDGELVARTWGMDSEYVLDDRELDYIRDWLTENRTTTPLA